MLLPKLNLIGIHGHPQAGKDTVAAYITSTYATAYREAFADPLKEAAAIAFGIPLSHFSDHSYKENTNPDWNVSPRMIAQYLGTEVFRETMGRLIPDLNSDFWIRRLQLRLENKYVPEGVGEYDDGDVIVIPDVRFQNEYDYIISHGGFVIHITRPGSDGLEGIEDHKSERRINLHAKEKTYEIENTGTLTELYKKVADIYFEISQLNQVNI